MTQTPGDSVHAHVPRPSLSAAVGSTAARLQEAYLDRSGTAQAARARGVLARLRRAAGSTPERDLIAWQSLLDELLPDFPSTLLGRGDAPSPSESAAFTALSFFAMHMQSQSAPMHVRGRSFAAACGHLVRGRISSDSLKPRFDAALITRSESVRRHHIRGLISLLRSDGIGFDYGWLARDLVRLGGPHRNLVLLHWGRDFARGRMTPTAEEATSAPTATSATA